MMRNGFSVPVIIVVCAPWLVVADVNPTDSTVPCKELLQVLGFGGVQSVEFSPRGTRLIVCHGGVVSLFDASSGKAVSGFGQGPLGVSEMQFSPDEKRLLTVRSSAEAKEATLWDTSTGTKLARLDHADGGITGIGFSPDRTMAFTEGLDGSIKLWDVHTGKQLRVIVGDMDHVMDAAFSSDGTKIGARCFWGPRYSNGRTEKAMKVWDVSSGRELISLRYALVDTPNVVLSADYTKALSPRMGREHEAVLWDVEAGIERHTLTREDGTKIACMAFSPDAATVATAAEERKRTEYWVDLPIVLWDAATGEVIRTISGSTGLVWRMEFSSDGRRLLTKSLGEEASIHYGLWDVFSAAQIAIDANYVSCLALSPDGRRVVSGHGGRERMKLWDTATGEELVTFEGKQFESNCPVFSPDGTRIEAGLNVYNTASGALLHGLGVTERGGSLTHVAFSPDETQVMTLSEQGVRLWDVGTGSSGEPNNPSHLDLLGYGASYAAFSPDGKTVLTGRDTNTHLWDASTGEELRSFNGLSNAAFSFNGAQVLAGSWDGEAILWDASSGERIRTFVQSDDHFSRVALSGDGSRLLTGSKDGTVRLWDTASGDTLHSFSLDTKSPDYVQFLAFSPDGARILAGTWNVSAKMWDAVSGEELATFPGTKLRVVQFSPDGNTILTGGFVGPPKLWDAKTGDELAVLEGHDGNAFGAAFTPDSATVLIWSSETGRATLWDVATGKMLRSPSLLAPGLTSAAFSRDGKRLLIGTESGRAFLWASGL